MSSSGGEERILPLVPEAPDGREVCEGDVVRRKHSLELIRGILTEVEVVTEHVVAVEDSKWTVEDEALRVIKVVNVVVDVEGIDPFTAAAIP